MIWILSAIVVLLAPAFFLADRKTRQTKTAAILAIAEPRGIVDERYVRIGGIDQWIGIRGEDRQNPVLLILHGGPGCSYSIFTPHLRAWERHFTVVQWDQRGSARTFARTRKPQGEALSFDQLTSDAAEVAEHVRMGLDKERVFLLASSLGSTFGLRLAQRRPDLFYAYIGTDQNVGMRREREEKHRDLLDRLRTLGFPKGANAIERIGPNPELWSVDDFETVTRWTMRSDTRGFRRTMKLLKNAVWYAPHWTLKDIRTFVAGMRYSLQQLLPEIVRYDAWEEGLDFEIPFFIFQGETDVLTPARPAKTYFDVVTAPVKRFALIEDAGHFAAFLQPEQFLRQLLIDVRPLSDAPRSTAVV